MAELLITPENCEAVCGAGRATFEFGGHVRMLNANACPMRSRLMFAKAVDQAFLIPREQWPDLIARKDREKSWIDDMVADLGVPAKDQDGLGYCHGYGPVTVLEIARAIAGLPYVELSAESVAGRVVGWRNKGGDPEEDLEVIAKYGACAASFMDKPNSITPSRWQKDWEENALLHRAEEFITGVDGQRWDFAVTCALRNIPTSPWFNWWSHCISGSYRVRYDVKTKKVQIKNRNNWGPSWGENGFGWFSEGTHRGGGTPTGILAIRVATPSEN